MNCCRPCTGCVFLLFLCFLCSCVLVLYLLVVRAASIDGFLCLSGSLPLLSCMLVLILCFEANKYDDDDDDDVTDIDDGGGRVHVVDGRRRCTDLV